MKQHRNRWIAGAALVFGLLGVVDRAGAQGLTVVDVTPRRHALTAGRGSSIVVEFDRPVARESVTEASFWAFGRWSGAVGGNYRFTNGDRTITLVPGRAFSAGEQVMVILSRDLQAMDGGFLRQGGYSYQFWTRSNGRGLNFREIDRFSTRSSATVSTRSYGGFGADLNGDGFLDLTIANEDTNDLRTYLNRGDRSGRLQPMLDPPAAVGAVPSPTEPSDFDGDGLVDVAVANTRGASISILLGRGDGTFAPAQTVGVGGEPRGLTLLDADGDGDVDVATSTFVDGRVYILTNDGAGSFSVGRSFGTGGGERAIAAADMDDDGLLDLVVGTQSTQEIHVYRANGGGGFTRIAQRASGGAVWMLVVGDVDRDGMEDVAVVNGRSDNAAILKNDGSGRLGPAEMAVTDPFPLATDLADLDGDGDLDWVTSSFEGGWIVFANNGRGGFSRQMRVAAPEAASCSIPMDLDRDGALDLVLIDEIADEVILLASGGVTASTFASGFETGDTSDWSRAVGSVAVVSPGLRGTGNALQVTVDGTPARAFVESRHPTRETSWSAAFDLNANRVDLAGGAVEILRFGAQRAVLYLERSGEQYAVRLKTRVAGELVDVGSTRVLASGVVRLQIEWSAATAAGAADGRAALLKRNRVVAAAENLANRGHVVNHVRLGLPVGSTGAGGGSFIVDEYVSSP